MGRPVPTRLKEVAGAARSAVVSHDWSKLISDQVMTSLELKVGTAKKKSPTKI